MHVFKDLQPYICTFEGCHDMLVTFPTRKLWSDHEFSVHRQRQSFTCYQCYQELETDEIFRQHLDDAHSMQLNHKQFVTAVSAARVTAQKPVINEQCPLCLKRGWTSVRAFTTHVGRHMEGIALASLPKNDETDSEADESRSTHSLPRTTESGLSDVISRDPHYRGCPGAGHHMQMHCSQVRQTLRFEVALESGGCKMVTQAKKTCRGFARSQKQDRDFKPEGNHVSEIQPRSHPLYQKSKDPDGLYRCPFQEESKCNHEPTAQKRGYE
jgi:uncharacterized CHY-type Zn-finger protein